MKIPFIVLIVLPFLASAQSFQSFEGAVFPPAGWTNGGCFNSTNNACIGLKGCGFNVVGDFIITPLLTSGTTISFDYNREDANTPWSMDIAYSSSKLGPWTKIGTLTTITTTCQFASYPIPKNVYVRFIDTRQNGSTQERYIDNVRIQDASLPIELIGFSARRDEAGITLNWSTASERSNAYFSIEQTTDVTRFSEIGRINGAGDSDIRQDYSFTDENPASGLNFYRLKQVDHEGSFTYSPVVSVLYSQAATIRLFPDPVTDQLHIGLEAALSGDGIWQVFDLAGRLMASGALETETAGFDLDVSTLSTGTYILRIVQESQVISKQFQRA